MKFTPDEVFFTSDSHFFHKRILIYCPNRKFSSIEEMNEGLIKAWNDKVPNGATVFHMGDFAFTSLTNMEKNISRLNGNIHIIRGNHDADFPKDKFVSIQNYKEITVGNRHIILCHNPHIRTTSLDKFLDRNTIFCLLNKVQIAPNAINNF